MSKVRERLDRIMAACLERMQEEVSALLGKSLKFSAPRTEVLSKEDFFAEPAGKSVLAHVKLEGDLKGHGCLLVPIRDAIRIGGTLIMLPESELETVISEEEYSEELEDSYGEIANIICGSLTSIFEEQYPKTFRLVRTEQEVILPVKVEAESDEPVPNGTYYVMRSDMTLEDQSMGTLQLLLPAEPFGLVETQSSGQEESADRQETAAADSGNQPAAETSGPDLETSRRPEAEPEAEAERITPSGESDETPAEGQAAASVRKVDPVKQKKRIDTLLSVCLDRVGEEVGTLLGSQVKIAAEKNQLLDKEDLLAQAGGKQVMARLEVRNAEGEQAFLFVSLRDAIYLGGTLIMLPESELEEAVRNEELTQDSEDAYGEIANIIAGVFTAVFEEQYSKPLGFVKTGLEVVLPVKIDPDSDDVLPQGLYYLSSGVIQVGERELGRLQAAFPARLFQLEGLAEPEETTPSTLDQPAKPSRESGSESAAGVETIGAGQGREATGTPPADSGAGPAPVDILIFTDDDTEAASIASKLESEGFSSRILHYRDPVHDVLSPTVQLVFLVMREVGEQGFAMAIKIGSSGLQAPLVAAGPAWTRTAVLKAVKYGAADILVTPATLEDIQEKIRTNLGQKAA